MPPTVSSLGTIRGVIRGIKAFPFEIVNSEMIDDRAHSKPVPSKMVFQDINPRDRTVVTGYEQSALPQDIANLSRWMTPSKTHSANDIATCGVGSKYFEYNLRGVHTHVSHTTTPEGSIVYFTSEVDSTKIYQSAVDQNVTESDFESILTSSTHSVRDSDETTTFIDPIFKNSEGVYPFAPRTLIVSKKIQLDIQDEDFLRLWEHNIRKYFHLIHSGALKLYIRYPSCPPDLEKYAVPNSSFLEIPAEDGSDMIGTTNMSDPLEIQIYKVVKTFNKVPKDSFIISVKDVFYLISSNGNSKLRTELTASPDEVRDCLMHYATFTQYNLNNTTNLRLSEKHAGVYLKIGEDFTNSYPVKGNLNVRHLHGSSKYRGILEVSSVNSWKVKQDLQINGLKADFNLSNMRSLNETIHECTKIYKKFRITPNATIDSPNSYVPIKSSNIKTTQGRQNLGVNYILQVGPDFYKLGDTSSKGKINRLFKTYDNKFINTIRSDFPEERFYDEQEMHFVYLPSKDYKNHESLESMLKEYLLDLDDVTTYDTRAGGGIREFFHCSKETLQLIVQFMKENTLN